jgi:hypothetical protein
VASFSIIPGHYDPAYIFEKAGVTNNYGFEPLSDGTIKIGYTTGDENKIVAAVVAYPVTYSDEVVRPRMLTALAAERYKHQQSTMFNGQRLPCDLVSLVMVNGAMTRMQLPGAPESIRWKLNGRFIPLDLTSVIAIGTAMADHVQACYEYEGDLAARIEAAPDIIALAAIDITEGWPQ